MIFKGVQMPEPTGPIEVGKNPAYDSAVILSNPHGMPTFVGIPLEDFQLFIADVKNGAFDNFLKGA